MTLNPLGGHFAEGEGAAGFFFGGVFLVGVGFLVVVVVLVAVGLGELLTVGELLAAGEGVGEGDSVTATLCDGRRERTSAIAKERRFIDHSI